MTDTPASGTATSSEAETPSLDLHAWNADGAMTGDEPLPLQAISVRNAQALVPLWTTKVRAAGARPGIHTNATRHRRCVGSRPCENQESLSSLQHSGAGPRLPRDEEELRGKDSNLMSPWSVAGSGLRLSMAEVTRLRTNEPEMKQIARFMRRATDGEDSARLAKEVEEFVLSKQKIRFAFDM